MLCPHCGAVTEAEARFCGACGRATSATEPSYKNLASPTAAPADLVGREIAGRYRVTAKLGEGGMGAVYRGEQISLKRQVAIKVLRPELSADVGLVRRFNAEAELAARLSHPNTVNIYDFGQDANGALFIAMEFLEGRSLRHLLTQEAPLTPARALSIGRQVAASLADAHAHGIVHRDLKPDNVMLTERGKERDVARVLDFGIAKLRDDDRATNAMTRAGDLVGTPQYMAPEQIKGDAVDGRTDVYALGAMLYEMITGRLPFEGPTVMAVLSKHLTETPPAPSERRPDLALPPQLDALVMAALAKEPAARPASMEAFSDQMAALAPHVGGATGGFGAVGDGRMSGVGATATPSLGTAPTGFATGGASAVGAVGAISTAPPGPPPPGPAPTGPVASGAVPVRGLSGALSPGGASATPAPQPAAASPQPYPPGYPPPYPPGYPGPGYPGPGYPAPSYPMAPRPVPAKGGSLVWLWILLGVLVVAGGATAVVLARRAPAADPSTSDDPPPDDPAPDDPPPADPWSNGGGGTAPAGWHAYRDPDGWSLDVPPRLPAVPHIVVEDHTRVFVAGARSVRAVRVAGDLRGATDAMFFEQVQTFAASQGATVVDADAVDDGHGRYQAELAQGPLRVTLRYFTGVGSTLVVVYTVTADYDDADDELDRVFASVRF
ncbi:MAG: serine/threonine-protein kinase [Kofleriaceae bacterium]